MKFLRGLCHVDVPFGHDTVLPRNFCQYIIYVYRKNPVNWPIFLLQDLVHFMRYTISLILMGKLVDILSHNNAADGIPHQAQIILWTIFAVLAIGEAAHIWTAQQMVHWKPAMRTAIRSDFLGYTLGHSHSYFQDNFAGALARKISEVAESTLRLHDIIRFQIWFAIVQMTVTLFFLYSVNFWCGLALTLFIVSITAPVILRLPRIRQRSLRNSEERAHVTGVIVDMLGNIPAVKSYSGMDHESSVHRSAAYEERKRSSKLIRNMIQIENYRRISLVCLGTGMALLSTWLWSKGLLTVGEAASVATMSMMLTGTTWMLGSGIVQFVDEAGYITDALNITTKPHDIRDRAEATPILVQQGEVRFNDVSFAFPGKPVFEELNVTAKPGEKIALVGPSGAGKSTFVALMLRFFDVDHGSITIDGQSIADVTQESLRRAIAVIPQDTALFHRSLIENIRYGRLDATDDEVIEAARKAYAHDFIVTLAQGYNTLVGERGIRLSGGQRQRIAIARAILKNAPILILDEATSALDSESERAIQKSLEVLMEGKTVFAIAHRLSTIAHMDRILVFDNGRIVEEGPHDQLIRDKYGLYARLWAMQSGGFIAVDQPTQEKIA